MGEINIKKSKYDRILSIYTELSAGELINKSETAIRFGVNERTIQRDIDDLRAFFGDNTFNIGLGRIVIYDRTAGGYRLNENNDTMLTNGEILVICKILLESRSLISDEMLPIINKLTAYGLTERNIKRVRELLKASKFNYHEPDHKTRLVDGIWELGRAIRERRLIDICYQRLRGELQVTRRLKPVGIITYGIYFYLTAYIDGCESDAEEHFPTIYRIDRIKSLKITDDRFFIPYESQFDEAAFREYMRNMHIGDRCDVRILYWGDKIEYLLDSIPTLVIEEETDKGYTLYIDGFRNGIEYWLRRIGDMGSILTEIQPIQRNFL